MKAIETFAVFDKEGIMTVENSPLLKNKKVKLLILIEEDEEKDFHSLSSHGLSKAYSTDEPEYDLSLVNEPNTDYAAR